MDVDQDSDDEYEVLSDVEMSDWEETGDTPATTPIASSSCSPPRKNRSLRETRLTCEYPGCAKTFNRKSRLEEHLNSHKNQRNFECTSCGKKYLRETHLKHHVKSAHTNVRDYQCSWEGCDKSFATGTRLRRHRATHENAEQFRCKDYEDCSATFRKRETLAKHLAEVHNETEMHPYQCHEVDARTDKPCLQTFVSPSKLQAHQRSKHDDTKFSCSECLLNVASTSPHCDSTETYFRTYAELQAHISEKHPPTCKICGCSFKTAKEFDRHNELGCNGFATPEILHSRPRATPLAKPFCCVYPGCGLSFSKSGNLTVHVKTVHENRKEFICGQTGFDVPEDVDDVQIDGCGRTFTSMAGLKDHVRSAHYGLESKQVQRKKRKAEARAADGPLLKTRKIRKDKGTKKMTALSTLTGIGAALPETYKSEHDHDNAVEGDGDGDVENFLSGSMTLLDDQLFHYDQQYDIDSPAYLSNSTTTSARGDTQDAVAIDPRLTQGIEARTFDELLGQERDSGNQILNDFDFDFDVPLTENPYFYQAAA